jgi:hypothetical protein
VIFIRTRDVVAKIFSEGFGTGNSSLCWTGLIADGKSRYFTVCLDLEVIPVMFVKVDEGSSGSLQTTGTAKGIWRKPFPHPVRSFSHVPQQM